MAKMARVREEEHDDARGEQGRHPGRRREGDRDHGPGPRQGGRPGRQRRGREGEAKARARVELSAHAALGGTNIGPLPGGGGGGSGPTPKISDEGVEGARREDRQARPAARTSSSSASSCRSQGFLVGENAAFGPVGKHDPGGYHYKCGNKGALDVNFGGPGDLDPQEVAAVDPIIDDLRELGFRTIWRASGHYNHLHVDIANSGPIGARQRRRRRRLRRPARGRAAEVKLIDYDAPYVALRRPRRRRRRLLHRPARPEGGARDLQRGARPRRVPEGAAGGLRGGDRRVRRAQPPVRRPRLDRALPAARLVGLLRPAHEPGVGLAAVPRQGDPPERVVDERGPARPGRPGLGLSRTATTSGARRRWR